MADIGGIINRLAPLIGEKVRREYNLLINAKTEARKLSANLIEVQKVLEEAERRRLADPRIRTWLERLQDVTYEIDDALDEWETLNLQLEIEEYSEEEEEEEEENDDDAPHTWWEKVSIFIESICSCSKHVFRRRDMALKIRELNEKVDLIGKETAKYTLLPISADSQHVIKCEITTSFSELFPLEGQEFEKNLLVKALLDLGTQEPGDHIQVISLVGMVGIGKTTLAQLAFRDPDVQSSFELKSWVCVSHISDMVSVAKAILRSLGVSYPEDAELQKLLELIQLSVLGRRFLLVLDHVWIEDDSVLNQLKASLCYGAPGSRVIVTSRNENIAKLMGSTKITVKQLSDKDCWLLFSGIAFRGRAETKRENLEGIGQTIARKCKGSPLTAKTLGCYLQSRFSKELWEDVLEKEVWQLDEVAKALFAPLALSYNELPLVLKHCFSYSAIFREEFQLDVDELIRLWMVQGYLSSSAADTDMEVKGRDYFEKLAVRSFFQDIEADDLDENLTKCRVQGILHDFARYLRKTESKVQELRSFYSVDKLSPNQLASLKSVRVLFLCYRGMQELPLGIGNLIHLRHLNLSSTLIERLPVTICKLYNLQSLELKYCTALSQLPKRIHRLRNLRHLLIEGSPHTWLPQEIEKLTLRTLDQFNVGGGRSKFGYLEKLNQLRGSIYINIRTLDEEGDVDEAKKANLKSKIYISDLHLGFEAEVTMDVMEALKAPPNLQRFRIWGYRGTQFPSWIGTSLDKLRELGFEDCNNCLELPSLGTLPFLENLSFGYMRSLKRVGLDFLGISLVTSFGAVRFPKLRNLKFACCDSWDEWEDITGEEDQSTPSIMPRLQKLQVWNCNKLQGLPHLILRKATSLEQLEISYSSLLLQCYQHSSDCEFISHIQHVKFFGK